MPTEQTALGVTGHELQQDALGTFEVNAVFTGDRMVPLTIEVEEVANVEVTETKFTSESCASEVSLPARVSLASEDGALIGGFDSTLRFRQTLGGGEPKLVLAGAPVPTDFTAFPEAFGDMTASFDSQFGDGTIVNGSLRLLRQTRDEQGNGMATIQSSVIATW